MRKIRMSKRLTALGQAITAEYEKVPCVDDTLLYIVNIIFGIYQHIIRLVVIYRLAQ